jgi:hypothetical protein
MMYLGKFHSHLHTLVIHFRLNSDRYQNILYYILMYTSDINRIVGGNTFRPTAFLFVYINVKEACMTIVICDNHIHQPYTNQHKYIWW